MRMDKQELVDRIKAADKEELLLMVKVFPGEMLIDEIGRRYENQKRMISGARQSLRMESDYEFKSKGSDEQTAERQIDIERMDADD